MMNDEKYWRPEEVSFLRHWHGRAPRSEIAKALSRSEVSVKLKSKRLKLTSPINWDGLWTARALGKALGIDPKAAWKLMTSYDDFPSVTLYCGNEPIAGVYKRTLVRFVADPLNWWLFWDIDNLVDHDLQRARDLARLGFHDKWVWIGDAARKIFVEPATVNQWIHKGWLPSARKYGNWRFLRSDFEATAVRLGYTITSKQVKK